MAYSMFARLALLASGTFLFIFHAHANPPPDCLSRPEMAKKLAKLNQHRAHSGVTNHNRQVEIYRTDDGTTWSLTITLPDGRACFVTTGFDWREVEPGE